MAVGGGGAREAGRETSQDLPPQAQIQVISLYLSFSSFFYPSLSFLHSLTGKTGKEATEELPQAQIQVISLSLSFSYSFYPSLSYSFYPSLSLLYSISHTQDR